MTGRPDQNRRRPESRIHRCGQAKRAFDAESFEGRLDLVANSDDYARRDDDAGSGRRDAVVPCGRVGPVSAFACPVRRVGNGEDGERGRVFAVRVVGDWCGTVIGKRRMATRQAGQKDDRRSCGMRNIGDSFP